jgi:hypothetical protein
MMFNGFPNAYMCYTPHAPTALSNGPTIIEAQCDFIAAMITGQREKGVKSVMPTAQAQVEWQALINMMSTFYSIPTVHSRWVCSVFGWLALRYAICDMPRDVVKPVPHRSRISSHPYPSLETSFNKYKVHTNPLPDEHTLFPLTNSWWNAANIPGKPVQMLTYPAGIKMYEEHCTNMMREMKGFEVEYWDGRVLVEGKSGTSVKEDARRVGEELDVGGVERAIEGGRVVLGVAGS